MSEIYQSHKKSLFSKYTSLKEVRDFSREVFEKLNFKKI